MFATSLKYHNAFLAFFCWCYISHNALLVIFKMPCLTMHCLLYFRCHIPQCFACYILDAFISEDEGSATGFAGGENISSFYITIAIGCIGGLVLIVLVAVIVLGVRVQQRRAHAMDDERQEPLDQESSVEVLGVGEIASISSPYPSYRTSLWRNQLHHIPCIQPCYINCTTCNFVYYKCLICWYIWTNYILLSLQFVATFIIYIYIYTYIVLF